ncbi:MAG: hypothetical protein U1F65_07465 [Verrucomicrobiota bacterium]
MKIENLFNAVGSIEGSKAACPNCRQAIPLDDINVVKDIALCRSCGKTWAFSQTTAVKELDGVDFRQPPKGVRLTTDHHGATRIVYRRLSPILIFLIPFTALWSGFSMWGIYGRQIRQGNFDLGQSLFGLPFLLGTIVLCTVILFGLFGRWEVRVRNGEGSCFVGVGPFGWRRKFAFGSRAVVTLETSSYRVNHRAQDAITIQQDGGKIISFGAPIPSREAKVFMAAAIQRAGR